MWVIQSITEQSLIATITEDENRAIDQPWLCSGISRSKILEALEASDPALQKRQRGVHPSTCYEESDSQSQAEGSGGLGFTTEDESVVDRRPQLLPPVPLPRSLAPSTAEFKTANKGMVVGASQDNISILTDGME